ncbi:hypothetical protein EVAR_29441_1 [Eumeta japonica]|uniref:Uncharacterized protein n=1 Tax=Eumeta variegata TaxID=151549 RepID=A0A4C1VSG9_EUMVA|nr:hypothetical protein EVAR_29441_1 [Eumeta japonica]
MTCKLVQLDFATEPLLMGRNLPYVSRHTFLGHLQPTGPLPLTRLSAHSVGGGFCRLPRFEFYLREKLRSKHIERKPSRVQAQEESSVRCRPLERE